MSVTIFISMYVKDLEETLVSNDFKGIEIGMLKLLLLLYADNIIIFQRLQMVCKEA